MPPEQKPQNDPNNSIPVREGLDAPELSSMIETESTQTALENQALDALSFARADEASLEPSVTEVQATVPLTADDLPKQVSKYRFWALRGGVVALVLLLVGLGGFGIKKAITYQNNLAKQGSVATNYGTSASPLNDLANQSANGLSVVTDSSARLTVNGTLDINGSLIINQSGKPANPVKGQIYYSKTDNKLWFYDGTRFIDITYASSAPTPVSSVQGQTGAVTFTGGRGISVTGTTISSTLPTGVQSLLAGSANISITSDGNGGYTITDANGGVGVELQNSTPGSPQTGNINITGTIIAGSFQGDGSGLTNLNASNVASGTLSDARLSTNVTLAGNTFNGVNQLVQLDGSGFLPALNGSALTNLNANNIASGTLADARLSANVTLQGNIFNGANQLVKLNPSGDLPALSAINLTNLNASAVTAGTLPDIHLSANVTLMGNTFNGANQLLQLTNLGYLPVINGSNVTALNASNISSGTLADGRLSANVALLNGNQTFSGSNTFSSAINANTITPSGALTVGATGQAFTLQGNGSSVITATSGGFTNTIGFTGAPIGNVAYNFDRSVTAGTYTICTTYGNCAGTGGGVTTPGGTANKLARFTGAQTIGDSAITDTGAIVTIQNSSDSINGFQIQNSAGTSNLFIADTTNTRIGIGMTSPAYTLDVNGDINSATGLRVAGNLVCDSSGCIAGGGSGFYIQNSTALQTAANFNIESTSASAAAGVVRGTTGQTADIFQVWQGATLTGRFMPSGNLSISGNYLISGSQISSSNLADYSNIAHLNGIQTFSANNTFTGQVLLQNSIDSTIALRIQNSAGTSNLFVADTTNTRIGIGTATPGYMLDVNGDINIPTGAAFRINGVAICGVAPTCAPSSGSSYYIQNSTALQTNANFNIVSANSASVGGIIRGASGQTADLFRLQDETGANVATFANNGRLILGQNAAATGTINFRHVTDIGDITLVPGSPGVGSYTLTLPAENGTLCSTGSICAGYASSSGSGNYIQNGTAIQTTANFAIQSAAAGSVGAVIRGATGQTANLLAIQSPTGVTMAGFTAAGGVMISDSGGALGGTLTSNSGNLIATSWNSLWTNSIRSSSGNLSLTDATQELTWSSSGVTIPVKLSVAGATLSTVQKLGVNAYTTADTLANVIFSASAATSKPLVVQGAASQSANLQEWQASDGQILARITSVGNLAIGTTAVGSANQNGILQLQGYYNVAGGTFLTLSAGGSNPSIFGSGTGNSLLIGSASGIMFCPTSACATTMGRWTQNGNLRIGDSTAASAMLDVKTSATTTRGINVIGTAGQTASLQAWLDTNGAVLSSISASGGITTNGVTNTFAALLAPTFSTASTGTSYYYVITATNAAGETVASTSLGMANNTSALAWTQIPGATGYKIYRNTSNVFTGGSLLLTTITNGATVAYTDTGSATGAGLPPTAPVGTKLVVQSWASQTANLQEWQTSTGAVGSSIDVNGAFKGTVTDNASAGGTNVYLNATGGTSVYTARFKATADGNVAQVLKANSATQTGDLLQLQSSTNVVLSGFNATGGLFLGKASTSTGSAQFFNSGGAGSITLQASNPGASSYTLTLPAETGTLCSTGSVCAGYAASSGSGSYIQNGTAIQTTANFAIQSAAAGSVGGIIRGAAGQTADLFQAQNSAGTPLFSIYYEGTLKTQGNGFQFWKDSTPTKAVNVGMAVPGSANGDNLVFSTYTGGTWSERARIENATGALLVANTGAAGTVQKFGVNAPTTADNLAVSILSTGATTSKGLVIQGVAGQAANLQEWQSSAGAVLAARDASGNLVFGASASSSTGVIRLQNATAIGWRNAANTADKTIYLSSANVTDGLNMPGNIVVGGSDATAGAVYFFNSGVVVKRTAASGLWLQTSGNGVVLNGSGQLGVNTGNSTFAGGTVEKLRVNDPVTVDNLANTILTANAATSKPLVVQGFTSQSANLQEWQSSAGTILSRVASTGAIQLGFNIALQGEISTGGTFVDLIKRGSSNNVQVGSTSADTVINGSTQIMFTNGSGQIASITNTSFSPVTNRGATFGGPSNLWANGYFGSSAAASVALHVVASASQSGNLQQWENSSNAVLSSVDANGLFNIGTASSLNAANSKAYISGTTIHATTQTADNWTLNGVTRGTQFFTSETAAAGSPASISLSGAGYNGGTIGTLGTFGFIGSFSGASGTGSRTIIGAYNEARSTSTISGDQLFGTRSTASWDNDQTGASGGTAYALYGAASTNTSTGGGNKVGYGVYGTSASNTNTTAIGGSFTATGTGTTIALQAISGNAASLGLLVKGAGSQTGDLQQWQNSGGTVLGKVTAAGSLQFTASGGNPAIYGNSTSDNGIEAHSSSNAASKASLVAQPLAADSRGVIVKGFSGQTANLQEWQDNTGAILAAITAAGAINGTSGLFLQYGGSTMLSIGSSAATRVSVASGNAFLSDFVRVNSSSGSLGTVEKFRVNTPTTVDNATAAMIATGADANKGLVIQANSATQSGNLLEIQTSSGGLPLGISGAGVVNMNLAQYGSGTSALNIHNGGTAVLRVTNSPASTSGNLLVVTQSATTRGAVIRGFASQSVNLQEWQDSTNAVLAAVNSAGEVVTTAIRSNDGNTNKYISANGNAFAYSTFGSHTFTLWNGSAYAAQFTLSNTTQSALLSTNAAGLKGLVIKGVASQTANLQEWQDSTGTILGSLSAAGDLTVKSGTFNGTLTVNGHIISGNTSGTTTVAVNANAGTGGSASISGNDTAGVVTVNTGTGAAAGIQATITFANAYGAAPKVVITPKDVPGGGIFPQYQYNSATGTFDLKTFNALTDSSTYTFSYQIIQ